MTLPLVLGRCLAYRARGPRVLHPAQGRVRALFWAKSAKNHITPVSIGRVLGIEMTKKAKIFIDGAAGTTGLEIRERLASRAELSLIALSEAERKEQAARKKALNEADLVILCLPDEAAREAVTLIDNPATRVIDASTAHRVAAGWDFGFAELEPDGYRRIAASKRVSNPGCWSTGFLAIVRPLLRAGIVPANFPLSANGVSGYSGGGKSMIAEFEDSNSADYSETVSRIYGLNLTHKHIPEMQKHSGLA